MVQAMPTDKLLSNIANLESVEGKKIAMRVDSINHGRVRISVEVLDEQGDAIVTIKSPFLFEGDTVDIANITEFFKVVLHK